MNASAGHVDALVAQIVAINPRQAKFLDSSLRETEATELCDLQSYIEYCQSTNLTIGYLAECYDLIVRDMLREQIFFQRNGRYRYSTVAEVAESVYFNQDYMAKYMHGLAITSCLWPHHRQLLRFFTQSIPADRAGAYLEIGPGHGLYMMAAMRRSAYDWFEGVDLSPTSVALTKNLLANSEFGGTSGDSVHYRVAQKDFLTDAMERDRYDAIVMGEVLEHVEQPIRFLERVRSLAAEDAFIFITTPVNAPAIDHIYLFDSVEAIQSLVREAGLTVRDQLATPYPGLSLEDSLAKRLAVNVALVLGKAT